MAPGIVPVARPTPGRRRPRPHRPRARPGDRRCWFRSGNGRGRAPREILRRRPFAPSGLRSRPSPRRPVIGQEPRFHRYAVAGQRAASLSPGEEVAVVVGCAVGVDHAEHRDAVAQQCDGDGAATIPLQVGGRGIVGIDQPGVPSPSVPAGTASPRRGSSNREWRRAAVRGSAPRPHRRHRRVHPRHVGHREPGSRRAGWHRHLAPPGWRDRAGVGTGGVAWVGFFSLVVTSGPFIVAGGSGRWKPRVGVQMHGAGRDDGVSHAGERRHAE